MTKAVLGIIGGSGIYDLPGLENVREEQHREPVGRAVRRRCGSARSPACRWCSCRATTRATGCRPPTSTTAPISTCSSAPASPIWCRCRPAARSRRSCRPAPSCWSTSSSTAPTSARARSSARGWSRMSRWRIRCRRGCASISPTRRWPRASTVVRDGTYVCMEGPQFSTLAESLTYKQLGYSVIGMTNMPEAKLAREAEICYATVAMVTDFDCWHPDHDAVTVQDIIKVLTANAEKAKRLVGAARQGFPARARAVPDRLRPRARHRADHRARGARSRADQEARRGGGAGAEGG